MKKWKKKEETVKKEMNNKVNMKSGHKNWATQVAFKINYCEKQIQTI